jgi:hypothetical protein
LKAVAMGIAAQSSAGEARIIDNPFGTRLSPMS